MKNPPRWIFGLIGILILVMALALFRAWDNTGDETKQKEVNLAIWSLYLVPSVIQDFETQTGIKVNVSNYTSNEELLAKLQAGGSEIDVAVPSDYMVFAMRELKLLKELDRSKITHFKELSPKVMNKYFDPDNKFSVPYGSGTTGIAVNQKLFEGKVSGWKDLFQNPALAQKFSLLDDPRETIGAALKALGKSMNSQSPHDLEAAKKLILGAKERLKAFSSETVPMLTNREVAVAHAYSSDALQASKQMGGDVQYIIPEEGCTFWIDNLIIPATAPHADAAHLLIDFLLDAANAAKTTQQILTAPSNQLVVTMLPPGFASNAQLFPAENDLAKCEMLQDLGPAQELWDHTWTEIKAGDAPEDEKEEGSEP